MSKTGVKMPGNLEKWAKFIDKTPKKDYSLNRRFTL